MNWIWRFRMEPAFALFGTIRLACYNCLLQLTGSGLQTPQGRFGHGIRGNRQIDYSNTNFDFKFRLNTPENPQRIENFNFRPVLPSFCCPRWRALNKMASKYDVRFGIRFSTHENPGKAENLNCQILDNFWSLLATKMAVSRQYDRSDLKSTEGCFWLIFLF